MTSPAIAATQRLLRFGFERLPIIGDDTEPTKVSFYRTSTTWHEVVLFYSATEARAFRTPVEFEPADPLQAPSSSVSTLIPRGDVVWVVHALLKDAPAHPT